MRKHLLLAGLLAALLGGLRAEAAPPQQKKPGKVQQGPVSADVLPAGKYVGAIQSPPDDNRMVLLKIEYQKVDVNPQALQRLNANVQRHYQQVLRLQQQLQQQMMQPGRHHNVAGTMQQLQRAIAQLQAAQMGGGQGVVKTTPATAEVEFQLTPDVKVRLQQPPEELDDMGKPRKYTAAELQAMKGKNPNLPGYEATLDRLEKDQIVQLTLVQVQKPSSRPSKPPKPTRDADPEGPAQQDAKAPAATEHKMQVSLILILNGKMNQPGSGTKR